MNQYHAIWCNFLAFINLLQNHQSTRCCHGTLSRGSSRCAKRAKCGAISTAVADDAGAALCKARCANNPQPQPKSTTSGGCMIGKGLLWFNQAKVSWTQILSRHCTNVHHCKTVLTKRVNMSLSMISDPGLHEILPHGGAQEQWLLSLFKIPRNLHVPL